ncbi:hypothetical protein OG196_14115 [Kitasatospora purpeofusca]|uniref:hypothetical protein n=1 Tax=Kitasatospora purpeofusca TaxID=67352 RepID=UPI002E0F4121|nr:hypothetical protein OG196_14115 [Kitasatospora purpeofusca]
MKNTPNLADLALDAWAEREAARARQAGTADDEISRAALESATYVIGADAALLLAWRPVPAEGSELAAVRADLPDTPGWYLRWATESEETPSLALHRPCSEGGHRDLVEDLAHLGQFLDELTSR